MIRRRAFIAGLGSAVAWPLVAAAQQLTIPVIGWLASRRISSGAGSARVCRGPQCNSRVSLGKW